MLAIREKLQVCHLASSPERHASILQSERDKICSTTQRSKFAKRALKLLGNQWMANEYLRIVSSMVGLGSSREGRNPRYLHGRFKQSARGCCRNYRRRPTAQKREAALVRLSV